jgi:hypothetical protein
MELRLEIADLLAGVQQGGQFFRTYIMHMPHFALPQSFQNCARQLCRRLGPTTNLGQRAWQTACACFVRREAWQMLDRLPELLWS